MAATQGSDDMGKTISHTTSSTSYQLGQRPAENRAIGHQSEASPRDVPDVKGGLMKDSMDLILRLFEGIDLAAEEHRAVDSARAVLPHQKRYNLWTIGNSNLDSRLVGNPAVRARVVSILTNLVSVLSPGIQFSRSQNQQDLHQDVQRVFEQASTIADVHPNQPARRSPINIIDFLDATNIEIKSRVDNLYELSPTLARPFENYDETEPRHVEEVELPKRRSLAVDSPLLENQRLPCQSIDQLRPNVVPASDSSTTSQDSPRTDASSSNSCTKHSSSRTDSTSIRSLFSKSAIPDSRQSPTDTSMSTLPLQAKQSHSELTVSTSKRASSSSSSSSSSYKDCEASFGDPPEVEEALEPAQSVGEHRRIDQDGLVYIWHQDSQDCKLKRSLLDTGTWENFISRSVQEELNLSIVKLSPMSFKGLGGHSVEVQDSVQPEWCFYDSSTRCQQFKFNVVPCIPGNRDIVIGSIAMTEMGIYLVKDGSALVIHEDLEELPAHERRQLQRRTRDRDTTITQTKIRQQFEARQADLVRQKEAAAKASSHTKSEGSNSQRDPDGSGNGQRQ